MGCENIQKFSEISQLSMLLASWYTDAHRCYNSNDDWLALKAAVSGVNTYCILLLQNTTLRKLSSYTNKFESCAPAASAGYAVARILGNRGEGALVSRGNNGGKEASLALTGLITILAAQVFSGNYSRSRFVSNLLIGAAFGYLKSSIDDAIFATPKYISKLNISFD